MFTPRSDDEAEYEVELANGPVSQRRAVRTSAAKRSRFTARRKVRTSHKGNKIGGMHQRANKRIGW